jgi:hypothetical protein
MAVAPQAVGPGEQAGGDTVSARSVPVTTVEESDLRRASATTALTAARIAPAEALMRAAARMGAVRPTWTLGLLVSHTHPAVRHTPGGSDAFACLGWAYVVHC